MPSKGFYNSITRTVEDVLARRCRLLFLDAAEAARQAAPVAALLGEELGRKIDARPFVELAARYATVP